MRIALSLLLFFGIQLTAKSQADSVLLLNGKSYSGKILGLEWQAPDSVLEFKDEKDRVQEIETYRIFSFHTNEVDKIIYKKNDFTGNYLSVNETKAVTFGSYDARQTFKPHVAIWTGFALGLGASIFDTWVSKKTANDPDNIGIKQGFFNSDPTVFPFLVPAVVSLSWSFPSFKLKSKNVIHKEYYKDENFYRGYHRIAKQKRMLSSLISSLAGVGTGMAIYYISN